MKHLNWGNHQSTRILIISCLWVEYFCCTLMCHFLTMCESAIWDPPWLLFAPKSRNQVYDPEAQRWCHLYPQKRKDIDMFSHGTDGLLVQDCCFLVHTCAPWCFYQKKTTLWTKSRHIWLEVCYESAKWTILSQYCGNVESMLSQR